MANRQLDLALVIVWGRSLAERLHVDSSFLVAAVIVRLHVDDSVRIAVVIAIAIQTNTQINVIIGTTIRMLLHLHCAYICTGHARIHVHIYIDR